MCCGLYDDSYLLTLIVTFLKIWCRDGWSNVVLELWTGKLSTSHWQSESMWFVHTRIFPQDPHTKNNNGPATDVNEVSDVTMFCETEVILNSSFLIIKMAANSTDLLCGKYYSQLKVTLSPESLTEMRMQNTNGTVSSTPYSGLILNAQRQGP